MQVPNQADIQSRLAYVSCVGQLGTVKAADYCDYIRPPIDRYGTLQFGSFDEIRDVGYHHGKTYFAGMRKAGLMRQFLQHQSSTDSTGRYFSLSSALRKQSNFDGVGMLSSSLESQASFGNRSPPVKNLGAYNSAQGNSALDSWAQTVGKVASLSSEEEEDVLVGEEEDEAVDSDQLLSDEEDDDGESGFLSQM